LRSPFDNVDQASAIDWLFISESLQHTETLGAGQQDFFNLHEENLDGPSALLLKNDAQILA
jgi:hypothetical protein